MKDMGDIGDTNRLIFGDTYMSIEWVDCIQLTVLR